jgi:hypothetical protein
LMQFSAIAADNTPISVTWSVEGRTSPITAIDASGVLQVAASETASTLIVRATSIANPSIFGTATVVVSNVAAGNLISVNHRTAISVPYGSPPWAWGLPTTVDIIVETAPSTHVTRQATISWNMPSWNWMNTNQFITDQPVWVHGTVILPAGVTNTHNLPLNTTIMVTAGTLTGTGQFVLNEVMAFSPIVGIPSGAPASATGLHLPSTARLSTNRGIVHADVTWDVARANYNPASAAAQTFTVQGWVQLPNWISNPRGLSLSVSVNVTVNAASAAPPHGSPHGPPSTQPPTIPGETFAHGAAIVVGNQWGAPATNMASFPVTTANIRNGHYNVSFTGLPLGLQAPTQIRIHNNAFNPQLQFTGLSSALPGTYTVRLTIYDANGVPIATSNAFTLGIHPPPAQW